MPASGCARPSRAAAFREPTGYARHRPERTLLYRLVAQHYPTFRDLRAAEGRPLHSHVEAEFEAYLKCGRLQHGFLRVSCQQCHAEKLVAFSCKKRGFCPSCGARRMAESAALLADDVLPNRPLRQWVLSLPFALRFLLATNPDALSCVLGIVYRTIAGQIVRKAGFRRETGDTGAVTFVQRFGSALNLNVHFHMIFPDGAYRRCGCGVGAGAGERRGAAQAGGFSLHAGVEVEPERRDTLERLCRYVSRPPVAEDRLTLTTSGHVRYRLKTPYRDGTTHVVLEPLDLMARLEALVPPARMHLTRYHGVLAPHSRLRATVTPAHRGVGAESAGALSAPGNAETPTLPPALRAALTWARHLKRVFGVELERCAGCGGRLRIVASIEEPAAIARILSHLERTAPEQYAERPLPPGARGPPTQDGLV
jgi:hypothetical protein